MTKTNSFKLSVISGFFMALAPASFAAEYKIDPAHSNVTFTVRHLVSNVTGEFKDFSGDIDFDAKKPEDSKIKADVEISSIDTHVAKRDGHLKSDDFFAAKKFPKMTFVSKKIEKDEDKKYKMTGDLTLHGVTKSVTLNVEFLGEGDVPGGKGDHTAGFTAEGKINRKEFGMTWNAALDKGGYVLGDDVTIHINVEAGEVKEKATEKETQESEKKAKNADRKDAKTGHHKGKKVDSDVEQTAE